MRYEVVCNADIHNKAISLKDIVRINMAVKNKTLTQNEALKNAAERAIKGNGRIHLAGLVSRHNVS